MNNVSSKFNAIIATMVIGFVLPLEAQDKHLAAKTSFCEVLKRLADFDGKRVVIRTQVSKGYLYSQECEIEIVTQGHRWPNAIVLVDSRDPAVRPEHRSGKQELISRNDANLLYRNAIPPGSVKLITVVGVIETRPLALLGPERDQPNGYGHLNRVPAQLVVEEIREVEIVNQQVK